MNRLNNLPEDLERHIWKCVFDEVLKHLLKLPDHPTNGLTNWRYEKYISKMTKYSILASKLEEEDQHMCRYWEDNSHYKGNYSMSEYINFFKNH